MTKILINNNTTEQVKNFNYSCYQLSNNRNYDLKKTLQRFNYLCGTMKCSSLNKSQQETILNFYKVLAVPALLYRQQMLDLNYATGPTN
jgi:hypothetical protein